MIIREISTIVPRQRITKLEYECEICGLKTTNKNEGIFHHAKRHIVPTGKPIDGVGMAYFFKTEQDIQQFWNYTHASENALLRGRWKGPGWYIHNSDDYDYLMTAEEAISDLNDERFEIQEKIDSIKLVANI